MKKIKLLIKKKVFNFVVNYIKKHKLQMFVKKEFYVIHKKKGAIRNTLIFDEDGNKLRHYPQMEIHYGK